MPMIGDALLQKMRQVVQLVPQFEHGDTRVAWRARSHDFGRAVKIVLNAGFLDQNRNHHDHNVFTIFTTFVKLGNEDRTISYPYPPRI